MVGDVWHYLVGVRQIRYGEIVVVAAFNLIGEAMLHGGADGAWPKRA